MTQAKVSWVQAKPPPRPYTPPNLQPPARISAWQTQPQPPPQPQLLSSSPAAQHEHPPPPAASPSGRGSRSCGGAQQQQQQQPSEPSGQQRRQRGGQQRQEQQQQPQPGQGGYGLFVPVAPAHSPMSSGGDGRLSSGDPVVAPAPHTRRPSVDALAAAQQSPAAGSQSLFSVQPAKPADASKLSQAPASQGAQWAPQHNRTPSGGHGFAQPAQQQQPPLAQQQYQQPSVPASTGYVSSAGYASSPRNAAAPPVSSSLGMQQFAAAASVGRSTPPPSFLQPELATSAAYAAPAPQQQQQPFLQGSQQPMSQPQPLAQLSLQPPTHQQQSGKPPHGHAPPLGFAQVSSSRCALLIGVLHLSMLPVTCPALAC